MATVMLYAPAVPWTTLQFYLRVFVFNYHNHTPSTQPTTSNIDHGVNHRDHFSSFSSLALFIVATGPDVETATG